MTFCEIMSDSSDLLIGNWVTDLEATLDAHLKSYPDDHDSMEASIKVELTNLCYQFREGKFHMIKGCEEMDADYLGSTVRGDRIVAAIYYPEADLAEDWEFLLKDEKLHLNDYWIMRKLQKD